jgi:hypothetical protein
MASESGSSNIIIFRSHCGLRWLARLAAAQVLQYGVEPLNAGFVGSIRCALTF